MAEGAVEKPLGAAGITEAALATGERAGAGAGVTWAESGMIPQQAAATIRRAVGFGDPVV
jgi:hypothetical protein